MFLIASNTSLVLFFNLALAVLDNNKEQSNDIRETLEQIKEYIDKLQNTSINNNATLNNDIKG